MELNEIIMDAISYPLQNIKALLVYLLLSVIMGIVAVATGISSILTGGVDLGVGIVILLIGIIVMLVLSFLIQGYSLDIIKIAINRDNTSPELDFNRQINNGLKYFVVSLVYMLIPIIISLILLAIFNHWLTFLIFIILVIIFAFALSMAQCRLAQTEDLTYALDIKGSFEDINSIGATKVILTIIVLVIISAIIVGIITAIFSLAGSEILTSIISTILEVYILFFSNRALGLLYSEK